MAELIDLNALKSELSKQVKNARLNDRGICDEFKALFKNFGDYNIDEYYNYTLKISSRSSVCYIPNQWIYIAACCCQYHTELKQYKDKLISLGIGDEEFEACHPSKDNKEIPDSEKTLNACKAKAEHYLSNYTGEDKSLLVRFLYDYDYWGGGKNIKRNNDFTESPVLNIANTINASSGLIGSIAKGLADNPSALHALMDSPMWDSTFNSPNAEIDLAKLDVPRTHNSRSYQSIFNALRTKPFLLLAGISGTGKSRIVRELAFRSCPKKLQDADGTTPGNYLMVEVKPNWHDSTELLGYYSNISKKYQSTKFVEFLALAKENPDVPFFVCLDEMNLAPVEQYFAEFLSIMETRRHPVGDPVNIKTGVLVKEAYMKEVDGWKGGGLTLPDNVFIIGTVNMDDTTHKFSRKVIDRAMTIEMNGGDLESMFGASKNLSYTEEWSLADFKPTFVQADEVVSKYGEYDIKTDTPDKIEAINKCLKGTPFEVSYRVLNELCVYLGVLLDSGTPYGDSIDEAVDQITLMKILPRIEGDEDLFKGAKGEENKLRQLRALFSEDSETYKKLTEMIARLDNGFTRFWP